MEQIQRVFDYEGRAVRTVIVDDKPWWVLKDVCDILALSDTNKVAQRLDGDELTRIKFVSGGQTREMYAVNESGLYNVILRSEKPEARNFKRWVTHDVLPQIRQTGTYNLIPKTLPEALRAYANEVERRQALEAENLKMLPKAEFHDAVSMAVDNLTIQRAAKAIGTGEIRLFRFLRAQRIFMTDNQPYQEYLDRGYFRLLLKNRKDRDGADHVYTQPVLTAKGLPWLRRLWEENTPLKVVGE